MKQYLRPFSKVALAGALGLGICAAGPAYAQSTTFARILQKVDPLLSHSGSQGYLGVLVADVDNDSATKLKLKDAHGALITLIDHDAPAGQPNGLKVNDVVTDINGQKIEAADQFGRLLKEIPAGRKVTLGVLREGNPVSVTLQLVDRKTMEHDVWSQIGKNVEVAPASSGMTILGTGGAGDVPHTGFHMPFFGSTLNVGAMVEPLSPQIEEYLGISNGILVKEVARKSEAAAAGLRPRDVILKVGTETINTMADWDRTIRANQGKSVAVIVLREGKQQTLNLQVDSKHKG